MFNFLGDAIDTLYKVLLVIIGIRLVGSGGIGFMFRIISSPLKIRFHNKNLFKLDNHLSDLQLLNLFYGINVSSIEDAEIAALAISRKKIRPQTSWLLPFTPQIGNSRHGKLELFLATSFVAYCFFATFYVLTDIQGMKFNQASFGDKSEGVFISELYVIDTKNNKHFNKPSCEKNTDNERKIIKLACKYLTSSDEYFKKELTRAINKGNSEITTTSLSAAFFALLGLFSIYAYSTHREINNKFIEFKSSELKRRKVEKYKKAFKKSPSKNK